ncbi:phospholipase domain-containing protein, partial [Acinetobacter baumannii]
QPANIQVTDGYTGQSSALTIAAGATVSYAWSEAKLYGWYDLIMTASKDADFRQQLAGRIETGQVSISDPAIGRRAAT